MNKDRKANIREMLRAEGLSEGKNSATPDWLRFKKRIQDEMTAEKPPRLVWQRPWFTLPRLVPAFALCALAVLLYYNLTGQKITLPQVAARTLKKGDMFRQPGRDILISSGDAKLTEAGGKIHVEATKLKADFILRQKVDMRIEHPLVTVSITGTRFRFDATASGGKIHLREGRLRIAMKSGAAIDLRAPARFTFDRKGHSVEKLLPPPEESGKLYRYELQNGEVVFGHPLKIDAKAHRIDVLGGGVETIAAEDILRREAVEKD